MGSCAKSIRNDLSNVKWSSVQKEVALCTRWATWSWSYWNKHRRLFCIFLAWSTYQRDWTCAIAASGVDPIKVRWNESEQLFLRWKLHICEPQQSWEGEKVGIISGRQTMPKPWMHEEEQRSTAANSPLYWTHGRTTIHLASQVVHGWTEEYVKYLD